MSFAHAKRRDENEPAIVEALEAAGASVTRLNEKGLPDLLVGFRGSMFLIEVKRIGERGGVKHGHRGADARGLNKQQQDWWAAWKGPEPAIAHTPAEAIAVIGAA